MTWWEAYKLVKEIFCNLNNEYSKFEADDIFRYGFDVSKIDLILRKSENICEKDLKKLKSIIEKRKKHIPLQYILGSWEFMGRMFKVGEGVLIPREDTAVLVESCLDYSRYKKPLKIVDLCSGSGCIAITLRELLEDADVYAVEISKKAFEYLCQNVNIYGSDIRCINGDIFDVCDDFSDNFFDMVVSNPPYIKKSELPLLQSEVKNEPVLALCGGEDGLNFYRKICNQWVPKIKSGGMLAFEVGQGQFCAVGEIMRSYGLGSIKVVKDINCVERVVTAMK